MTEYKKITLRNQDYKYDLDPDLIYNFTQDQVKFIYTNSSNNVATTNIIYTKQLNSNKKLHIQSVLCCRTISNKPILIIIAKDIEQVSHIYSYNVLNKQHMEINSKSPIQHDITKSSITRGPFRVVFMTKESAEKCLCYALVIGTSDGNATLILLYINENTTKVEIISTESIKQKNSKEVLGYVTSIYILPPDTDRRMGHSDPQILLGYSLGSILVYRFRANIYDSNASRLRIPVNLSAFTEFRNYPITHLSCARSYNSLAMTIAFSQEKPHNDPKYKYSQPYVKLVETHGNSTSLQRKIINPSNQLSTIMEAKLLLSTLTTFELDSIVQLSIIFQTDDMFKLSMWHISPQNVHKELDLELDKNVCFEMMHRRNILRSDDLIGFYNHTPQKLVQHMLQHEHGSQDEENKSKRKHDDVDNDEEDVVVAKKGKEVRVPRVVARSDTEEDSENSVSANVGADNDQLYDTSTNELSEMEDIISPSVDTRESSVLDPSATEEEEQEDPVRKSEELDESTMVAKVVELIEKECVKSAEEENVKSTIETLGDNATESSVEEYLTEATAEQNLKETNVQESVETIEENSEDTDVQEIPTEANVQESLETVQENSAYLFVEEPVGTIEETYIGANIQELVVEESVEVTEESSNNSVQYKEVESVEESVVPEFTLSTEVLVTSSVDDEPKEQCSGDDKTANQHKKSIISDDYLYVDTNDIPNGFIADQQGAFVQKNDTNEQVTTNDNFVYDLKEFDSQVGSTCEQEPVNYDQYDYEQDVYYGQDYGDIDENLYCEPKEFNFATSVGSSVPASNNQQDITPFIQTTAPTIDYIPVMQQDLLRLLEDANIPLISDITINENVSDTNMTERNVYFTPPLPEITLEEKQRLEIEQRKLESEQKFSNLLAQIIGNNDIDSFMNQALISEEEMDKLGSECWLSVDARLKLWLIRYCDKHQLGEQVVSLCKILLNNSILNNFSKEEEIEFKRIYKKYLKDFPSYNSNEAINIFTKEGRHKLLQREANYVKSSTFNSCNDNNKDQKKNDYNYIQYYWLNYS